MQDTRIRFKFCKKNEFKYLSHLDISRIIKRALGRAGFRVLYSRGYNPKPKIGFSPPTPLGVESLAEYADVIIDDNIGGDEFKRRINRELKEEMQVTGAKNIFLKAGSLMNEVGVSLYAFTLDASSSGKGMMDKLKRDIKGGLFEKSGFLNSIYDMEILHSKESSDIIFLKLYGYAKIFKEESNEFFKFNNFYPFFKERLKEYKINITSVKKEELFIIAGDKIKTPLEIIQAGGKGEQKN
jgi:hypothetical protein